MNRKLAKVTLSLVALMGAIIICLMAVRSERASAGLKEDRNTTQLPLAGSNLTIGKSLQPSNTSNLFRWSKGVTVLSPLTAVDTTSPTKTVSATGRNFISLTSDQNLTGWDVIDGTTGQILVIMSGAGSNTMRFDDSAGEMDLGANITLTEGQNDVLALICVTGGTGTASKWARLFSSDN